MRLPAGLFLFALLPFGSTIAVSGEISAADAKWIGQKVWRNESGGTREGLIAWNSGEDFPSLGIGHFIWYPEGKRGPFDESFPKLIGFLRERDVKIPAFLFEKGKLRCPWNSRTEFLAAHDSTEMRDLREFLSRTVDLQAEFLVQRLQSSLPKMLEEAQGAARNKVQENFRMLQQSRRGTYALVDYVNFKGEGILPTERYRGQGWGLLQVLQEMEAPKSTGAAPLEFSRSASAVLRRRVRNSPPERAESRWLRGWLKRTATYAEE